MKRRRAYTSFLRPRKRTKTFGTQRGTVRVQQPRIAYTTSAKANQALMLIRKLKKDQERKTNQSMVETMQIPIGGNWIVENFGPYMQQGDNTYERVGNRITIESLTIRGLFKVTALEATGCSVRVIVAADRRPSGAAATTAMLMETDNQILSGYNTTSTYAGRFQVYFDKTYSFTAQTGHRAWKLFVKKPIQVKYTGNGGTVGDLQKNNFFICAMAEGNAAAIDVDYGFRFRFTDD